jgi:hypothetical protein
LISAAHVVDDAHVRAERRLITALLESDLVDQRQPEVFG